MIKPLDYVSKIKPYKPGKPIEELERELGIKGSIKLASNENPIGPSKKALKSLKSVINGVNRYPDGGGYYLKRKISEKLFVKEDEIILGNGSNELLDTVVRTYMKPGDEAVMASPSFVYYAIAVRAQGGRAIEVPTLDFRHDLKAMAKAITKKTKIVFVCNPNNPTGTINSRKEFDVFMKNLPDGVLVVSDEAYYEYVSNPEYGEGMKHFKKSKNVLILRTFSKIYGLAGLRIGYGIADKRIIGEMDKIRNPFNTDSLAQAAAIGALDDKEHLKRSRRVNEEGKKYLYKQLSSLGIKYVPTEANFIFLPIKDALILYNKLLKMGVIVRPMGPEAIRVTIGLPSENRRFIESLKKVI